MHIILIDEATTKHEINEYLLKSDQTGSITYLIHLNTPLEIISMIALNGQPESSIEFVPQIPKEILFMTAAIIQPNMGIMPPLDISAKDIAHLASIIPQDARLHLHQGIPEDIIQIATRMMQPHRELVLEQGISQRNVKMVIQSLPLAVKLTLSSEHSEQFIRQAFQDAFPNSIKHWIYRSSSQPTHSENHRFFQHAPSRQPPSEAELEAANALLLLNRM